MLTIILTATVILLAYSTIGHLMTRTSNDYRIDWNAKTYR